MHLQLRSILPIEWFPAIARIIVEQMRANANEGTKVETKMETYAAAKDEENLTPGARHSLQEKIREEAVMKDVILLAAHLNRQSENFSSTQMTNENMRSLRTYLFTK